MRRTAALFALVQSATRESTVDILRNLRSAGLMSSAGGGG